MIADESTIRQEDPAVTTPMNDTSDAADFAKDMAAADAQFDRDDSEGDLVVLKRQSLA